MGGSIPRIRGTQTHAHRLIRYSVNVRRCTVRAGWTSGQSGTSGHKERALQPSQDPLPSLLYSDERFADQTLRKYGRLRNVAVLIGADLRVSGNSQDQHSDVFTSHYWLTSSWSAGRTIAPSGIPVTCSKARSVPSDANHEVVFG